jgi:molecular chaperone DnaJ
MDYYKVLGVEKNASDEEISKAYRQKAMRLHPDVNPDPEATEEFKRVSQAYEVLGDSSKRAQYDRFGEAGPQPVVNPFDLFSQVFNTGRQARGGRDQIVPMEIEFEEMVSGGTKELEVPRRDLCSDCNGSGAKEWIQCEACQGRGSIVMQQRPFVLEVGCGACGRKGRAPAKPCDKCGGEGLIETERKVVEVSIPPGVVTGMQIRVAGHGDLDANGVRGDLYISLIVKPHAFFKQQGLDLWCEIPFSYTQLVFGTTVTIPTLSNKVEAKIPPGTQPGTKLRLRGRGIPDVRMAGSAGDIIVIVGLEVPTELTDEYKNKLEELSTLEDKFMTASRHEYLKNVGEADESRR